MMKVSDIVLLLFTFIVLVLINFYVYRDYKENHRPNYVLDLPEEISQANNGDTLYCIKRNDTLFIQFK